MTGAHPLKACRAARIPAPGLAALAPLRAKGGVRVITGDPVWVTWECDRDDVTNALIAVPGVEFFEPRDGQWFQPGARLPAFDVPPRGEAVALDRAIVPAPFVPLEPDGPGHGRIPLKLVWSEAPRPTSAIRCRIGDLRPWADSAPAAEIVAVKSARCGDVVWLVGARLPAIAGADRYWATGC